MSAVLGMLTAFAWDVLAVLVLTGVILGLLALTAAARGARRGGGE
jgi:hypothetical protein